MTDIEQNALAQAVAAAGRRMQDYAIMAEENVLRQSIEAHARAIEQHEAFRQEVSDAVEKFNERWGSRPIRKQDWENLFRFIISKPVDPLVEAWQMAFPGTHTEDAKDECFGLRSALAARGLEIVEKKP